MAETAPERKTEESATESETKKIAKNEAVAGETNCEAVAAARGYSRERPPVDDCCPICFDAFRFPSRTSCGHWFCSNCIMKYWRYREDFKQCKCPICSGLITNLVPDSSVQIQSGPEVTEILKDINLFNQLNTDQWFGFFLRTLKLPLLIRTRRPEDLNVNIVRRTQRTITWIGIILSFLYREFDCNFFPYGASGVHLLVEFFGLALLIYQILVSIWDLRRRGRQVAQQDAHLHIE